MRSALVSTIGQIPKKMTFPDVDAYCATLASSLGMRSKDLAELGGFSDRFARDLLAGRCRFPSDVQEALEMLEEDVSVITDVLAELDSLAVYKTNCELRAAFKQWPARGESSGGFVGPHRVAVISAHAETGAPIVWSE